jgi:hypothetical protein
VVTATDGQATSALVSSNTATVVANTPVCPVPAARDARTHIEAETWNDQDQVTTWGPCIGISHLDQGDWIRYDNVDFGATSPTKLVMRLGTPDWFAGKKIYLRADTATGPVIATLTTQGTGADWDNFEAVEQTAKVTGPITGTHRVFLTGPSIAEAPLGFGLGNIDWFTFTD